MKQTHVSLHWSAIYYSTNTLIIDVYYITKYWVQYSINTIWSIAKVCDLFIWVRYTYPECTLLYLWVRVNWYPDTLLPTCPNQGGDYVLKEKIQKYLVLTGFSYVLFRADGWQSSKTSGENWDCVYSHFDYFLSSLLLMSDIRFISIASPFPDPPGYGTSVW